MAKEISRPDPYTVDVPYLSDPMLFDLRNCRTSTVLVQKIPIKSDNLATSTLYRTFCTVKGPKLVPKTSKPGRSEQRATGELYNEVFINGLKSQKYFT